MTQIHYREKLESIFKDQNIVPENFEGYLLKGDISGIQDFIFNTKSKGASKTLKAKSFFVQALAEMCIAYMKHELGENNIYELYNGGGNFYLFVPKEDAKLKEIQTRISKSLCKDDIYVTLSWTENLPDFKQTKSNLEKLATQNKFKKFESVTNAFESFQNIYRDKEEWRDFARNLTNSSGFEIDFQSDVEGIFKNHIQKFNTKYTLSKKTKQFENSVLNVLPTWNQTQLSEVIYAKALTIKENGNNPEIYDIIDFSHLADMAKYRTGTDKLGVLKMDVDNLGSLFGSQNTIEKTCILSNGLKWFFEEEMRTLLCQEFEYIADITKQEVEFEENGEKRAKSTKKANLKKAKYIDNIYVVFSGGDDCFMLGAYDAIIEFSLLIYKEFQDFQHTLRTKLTDTHNDITLSASILLVDGSFPVTRFSELAEDALKNAKKFEKDTQGNYIKNKISIFGQVLKWTELEKAKNIVNKLLELILVKSEPRGILERIKNSVVGYESLQNRTLSGNMSMPKIWRLKYYLRNVKKENKVEMEALFDEYCQALIKVVSKKETINPETFRVAARWAEFLTRKDFENTPTIKNYA